MYGIGHFALFSLSHRKVVKEFLQLDHFFAGYDFHFLVVRMCIIQNEEVQIEADVMVYFSFHNHKNREIEHNDSKGLCERGEDNEQYVTNPTMVVFV